MSLTLPGGMPVWAEGGHRPLTEHLTTTGSHSAVEVEINANGAGYTLGSPGYFWIAPPAGQVWFVYRMLVLIQATGNFSISNYGPVSTLTNGVRIQALNTAPPGGASDVWHDYTGGVPVISESHLALWMYDVAYDNHGVGPNAVRARMTLTRFGQPLRLYGTKCLCAIMQDDLSAIADHHFVIEGVAIGDESTF